MNPTIVAVLHVVLVLSVDWSHLMSAMCS